MVTCDACGKRQKQSAPISSITIWVPTLHRPYPLIPAEEYTVCTHDDCDALFAIAIKAIDAHPETRGTADNWIKAVVVFDDASGAELLPKRDTLVLN